MEPARDVEFVFEPEADGGYYAYAPELPGLHSQGEDLEEATANAEEALSLYVAVPLIVPLHRELKRGTLAGILRDAGIDPDELRRLLRS